MRVVHLNLNNFAPAITDEDFFPVEATDRCPTATGMCRVRLRVIPSLGGSRFMGGGAAMGRASSGRMRKRRTSMFPSTAIKEGNLYIRVGGGGQWKSCHFVLTKEQLNYYEDALSMKKLDQIHLLTPLDGTSKNSASDAGKRVKRKKKDGDSTSPEDGERLRTAKNKGGGDEAAFGLNERKTCYLAMSWDYENAQRSSPTEKTVDVVSRFRPWHDDVRQELEKKRLKTTILSEKEKKHSLLMFRKICQASGVLPTLRIDLYAGDGLRRTCNPYIIFNLEGGCSSNQENGEALVVGGVW